MNCSQDVAAVIPIYHPTDAVYDNIETLLHQVDRVVAVDDGTGPAADQVLDGFEALGVEVLRLPTNGGIAGALNAGVTRILEDSSVRAILTLDQDSCVSEGFVASALTTLDRLSALGVGIVVPALVNDHGVPIRGTISSGDASPLEPIQSGMLIARSTFERLGLFRAELVIDCVDSDFFLRAKRAGVLTAIDLGCSIRHELGEPRRSVPGREGFSYHSPVRRFYITRNRLTILREFRRSDPEWFRTILWKEIVGFTVNLAFGSDRVRQVLAAWYGARASMRGQFGLVSPGVRHRIEPRRQ